MLLSMRDDAGPSFVFEASVAAHLRRKLLHVERISLGTHRPIYPLCSNLEFCSEHRPPCHWTCIKNEMSETRAAPSSSVQCNNVPRVVKNKDNIFTTEGMSEQKY